MYTTLLVYKEEYVLNPDYETIKVLDLSIPGDAREKLLYCCKYRKSFEENKRDSPLDTNQ